MLGNINKFNFGQTGVVSQVYCLYNEVDDVEAKNITEWILSANHMPPEQQPDVLNLFINSPGGSVTAAWAIIDMMRGSSIPVRTVGIGQIASCGLLIFTSGEKGFRIVTENTSILSHQFASGTGYGKLHELLASNVEFGHTQNRLLKHLAKCTGMSISEVNTKLMPPHDVWLTSQEAVKLGLADKVANLR